MASACHQAIVTAIFVGSGTLVSIVMKITFDMTAPDKDGTQRKFHKPWCAMLLMCCAMASLLFKYAHDKRHGARCITGATVCRVALKIAVPSFLQLFGTFLQAAGLMWTPVSVYQMLTSATVIFSAMIRYFLLGKGLAGFEACGIVLVTVGLSGVGAASIVFGSSAGNSSPIALQILGIVFLLCAQAILALEAVLEERVLQCFSAPPEFVCGMMGLWGIVYTLLIFIPLAQELPGVEGVGLHEDSEETLYMIMGSHAIQALLLIFFVAVLLYNITMRMLISMSQATTMQVLVGLRTLCVWAVALLMYDQWPEYGERWVWSTWIELGAFLVLILGVFIYRGMIKLPCFEYPTPAKPLQLQDIPDDVSRASSWTQACCSGAELQPQVPSCTQSQTGGSPTGSYWQKQAVSWTQSQNASPSASYFRPPGSSWTQSPNAGSPQIGGQLPASVDMALLATRLKASAQMSRQISRGQS